MHLTTNSEVLFVVVYRSFNVAALLSLFIADQVVTNYADFNLKPLIINVI